MPAEIVGSKLHLDGYMYYRTRERNERTYWECLRSKKKECSARAVSIIGANGHIEIVRGPANSPHSHPPNVEENVAEKFNVRLKRRAHDHPEERPAQMLRTELQGVDPGVLSQLPEQPALVRKIQRARKKHMPASPRSLDDVLQIPDVYQKTLVGEMFLLHDSRPDDEDELSDDDVSDDESATEEPRRRRVIVFSTRKNIELLCESTIWFLDGTFKTAPAIFAQIFTVIGLRRRIGTRAGAEENVAIPLVYCLLSGKDQSLYEEALQAVHRAVHQFRVAPCAPIKIMTDFELAIIQATKKIFPATSVSACFFHLGQIIYRQIQAAGLQARYSDTEDRSIKKFSHMLMSLAFVPVGDIRRAFTTLRAACPAELHGVFDFFKKNYITGTPARGTRRATAPRYSPPLWNQYATALVKSHRTNNVSEGWHNRFSQVVGKHHPDLYSLLSEFQTEQGYTEICVQELALGKKVRYAPSKKWQDLQIRLESIAAEYDQVPILEYLANLSYNVSL